MLPEQEQKMYDAAVKKLKEQFRPVDIAELKGFEFHHRMQLPEEPVEQLGIALQNLVRKAFPQAKGREFDRLLKGRFFQALRTKWVKWGTLRGSVRLLPPNLRPWFKLKLLCRYAPTITKQWNSINLIILYNE